MGIKPISNYESELLQSIIEIEDFFRISVTTPELIEYLKNHHIDFDILRIKKAIKNLLKKSIIIESQIILGHQSYRVRPKYRDPHQLKIRGLI